MRGRFSHREGFVFDAEQITERTFGQRVGVSGANMIFASLSEANFEVQDVGF